MLLYCLKIERDYAQLLFVKVTEKYRHQGYGTILIKTAAEYISDRGEKYMYVDDCSDSNIYYKLGFQTRYITKYDRVIWKDWTPKTTLVGPERRIELAKLN